MEMGAAITVLIAARNGIPVSTTNCIVGATIGVGIISGGVKNVNWKIALFTLCAWLLTLPACGLMSGLLYAFGSFTPAFGCAKYTMSFATTFNASTTTAFTQAQMWAVRNASKISLSTNAKSSSVDPFASLPSSISLSGSSAVFYSPGCAYLT